MNEYELQWSRTAAAAQQLFAAGVPRLRIQTFLCDRSFKMRELLRALQAEDERRERVLERQALRLALPGLVARGVTPRRIREFFVVPYHREQVLKDARR